MSLPNAPLSAIASAAMPAALRSILVDGVDPTAVDAAALRLALQQAHARRAGGPASCRRAAELAAAACAALRAAVDAQHETASDSVDNEADHQLNLEVDGSRRSLGYGALQALVGAARELDARAGEGAADRRGVRAKVQPRASGRGCLPPGPQRADGERRAERRRRWLRRAARVRARRRSARGWPGAPRATPPPTLRASCTASRGSPEARATRSSSSSATNRRYGGSSSRAYGSERSCLDDGR